MSNQIYTIAQLKDLLNPIFEQYNVKKAILFGAYAKGIATENSDIDLLVDSGLHGLSFVGLKEDLCNAVGKEIDVFDVTHIEKDSKVDDEIQKTGIVIYEEK